MLELVPVLVLMLVLVSVLVLVVGDESSEIDTCPRLSWETSTRHTVLSIRTGLLYYLTWLLRLVLLVLMLVLLMAIGSTSTRYQY